MSTADEGDDATRRLQRNAVIKAVKSGNTDALARLILDGAPLNDKIAKSITPLILAASKGSVHTIKLLVQGGASVIAANANGETAIHVAVRSAHTRAVRYLANAGSSVNAANLRGDTLLHVATWKGLSDIVQLLIEKGASVETKNAYGETPLHGACFKGELACAQLILNAGAAIEAKNTYGERPLHSATFKGHVELVRLLIRENAAVNEENASGATPLSSAATNGHLEIAQLLLENGATVNQPGSSGFMPLHSAALNGDVAMVKLLVAMGADIDARTPKNATALLFAAGVGHVGILKVLIEAGASIQAANTFGETPLHSAVNKGHLDAARFLIERGAAVHARNSQGMTPLYHAAFHGYMDLVTMLAEHGAEVDAAMPNGQTALFAAAKYGHVQVAAALIQLGAAIDIVNAAGKSPLALAARASHLESVRLLLSRGACIDAVSPSSKSALFGALSNGNIDVIKFLIDVGASVEKRNAHGEAPLHAAVFKGHADIVQLLINAGASLRSKNAHGETPLHIAALRGSVEMVQLLIDQDAVINATNAHGDTPLNVAAAKGHLDVVLLLIERSAPMRKKNMHGETALHAAASNGHLGIVKALVQAGAPVDTPTRKLRTPLYFAASGGHADVVQFLVEEGSSINAVNSDNETPLVAAARVGQFDIVKLLLSAGASVNVRAVDGETPLSAAAHWTRLDVVQLLIESDDSAQVSGPDKGSSLISATLETIRSRSSTAHEFLPFYELVLARLQDIWLQFRGSSTPTQSKILIYAKIIYRFYLFMEKFEKTDVIDRLITSRKVTSSVKDFHQEIDHLMGGLGMDCTASIHSDWPQLWEEHRLKQVSLFEAVVADDEQVISNLREDADQVEAITLLRYELGNHSHKYSSDKLDLMNYLLDKVVRFTAVPVPQLPIWFLPRHEVERQETIANSAQTFRGNWLNADITIYYDNGSDQDKFEQDADAWYQLSHPNVIKLFGACHIGRPCLFIYEYASNGNLRNYLQSEGNRSFLWRRLYEAALGLQYLHERKFVHGRLRCENILVGSDGKAKLAGFQTSLFEKREHLTPRDMYALRWRSPECARGEIDSFESDVYSLGMCMYEAVSGEIPWSSEPDENVHFVVRRGWPHVRPEGMTWDQWDVVKKTFTFDPRKRVKIGYVVERLKHFATEEHHSKQNQRDLLTSGNSDQANTSMQRNQNQRKDLSEYLVPELCATFAEALEKIQAKCTMLTESQEMALHVHARLTNVYSQLLLMDKLPTDIEVAKFCTLLSRFQRFLRTPTSDMSAIRMAKSRKAAEASHVFHGDIDRLLEILGITDVGPVHHWKHRYHEFYKTQYGSHDALKLMTSLSSGSADSEGPSESDSASTEFNSAGDPLALDVTEAISESGSCQSSASSPSVPPWFLPMHELFFDELDRIGEGSFGAVYRGTWLDTPVVVKFMGYEDDDTAILDIFLHEAAIWHQLNHPHVVKLFGACHLGKRFFVCEYASHGTLRGYLQNKDDRSLMWRKLYEVSLGLQYLHDVSVVHNDLKCDNILIGSDNKAKITDFGLSCTPKHMVKLDPKQMGALQWKAPEILTGGKPSFASDIYGLAMCIVEAVKGEAPWGRTADVMVRLQVRKGNLPPRPDDMSDEQWSLMEMMCVADPSRRVKISFVVEKLKEISELEFEVDSLDQNAEP